jgi:RNA polymerase subunit RPABC4/transcription elongation factor Spt4
VSPLQIGVVIAIPHLDHTPMIEKKNCHGKMLTQFWSPILVILITTSQNWKDYFIYIFVIYSIDNSHICTNLNAPKI